MFKFWKKKKPLEGYWQIFNAWEENEFAECSHCGHEVNADGKTCLYECSYPEYCPGCKAHMLDFEIVS